MSQDTHHVSPGHLLTYRVLLILSVLKQNKLLTLLLYLVEGHKGDGHLLLEQEVQESILLLTLLLPKLKVIYI